LGYLPFRIECLKFFPIHILPTHFSSGREIEVDVLSQEKHRKRKLEDRRIVWKKILAIVRAYHQLSQMTEAAR
jgi:hypothetical protein